MPTVSGAALGAFALAVGVADCVPVFIAHPSGIVALLHSGWRGTAAHITTEAIAALARNGLPPDELAIHLGPAICGRCYEVSIEVREQLTGEAATRPGKVDLRSLIAEHATETWVQKITVSPLCTRCDNDRFFSHRAGDAGRQIGVIAAQAQRPVSLTRISYLSTLYRAFNSAANRNVGIPPHFFVLRMDLEGR